MFMAFFPELCILGLDVTGMLIQGSDCIGMWAGAGVEAIPAGTVLQDISFRELSLKINT